MTINSVLKVIGIHAEKSAFEWNRAYIKKGKYNHEIDLILDIMVDREDEQHGMVILGCDINQNASKQAPFTMHVMMNGEFRVNEGHFRDYIANSISMLFPYLRAHVSTITSISGVESLVIPAINVLELLKDKSKDE